MANPSSRSSRGPVASSDLLAPPNFGRALTAAGIAAAVGALAWGAMVFFAHREFSLLAWGIGLLVGFACVKGGGYGTPLAVAAGVFALLSILFGKMFGFRMILEAEFEKQFSAMLTTEAHQEMATDAEKWAALEDKASDDAVSKFILDRGYDYDEVAVFRQEIVPDLVAFHETKPSLEDWRDSVTAEVVNEASFIESLKADFHPLDLLFVGLGIASAFGLVSRHTAELQVEARRQLRDERGEDDEEVAEREA